jgi:hypothetical protein
MPTPCLLKVLAYSPFLMENGILTTETQRSPDRLLFVGIPRQTEMLCPQILVASCVVGSEYSGGS